MEIERFGDRDILLTFQEAAHILRVSRATLYRLLGSGQLVGHKVGRGWRFYKTDIHAFVAAQSVPRTQGSTAEASPPPTPQI
jgi:excisionase family DNA binding protein